MSKTKTPFFSMGARGSVGESITAQKLRGETLVRGKPCPTDPYSLPQAYQRWLYEDYAYLWTQQSAATKQEYASAGVRHHLAGFHMWMREMLTTLPDIAAWYKLDEKGGAILYDSSRNANDGIIAGPSPTDGLIDGAFYFDGNNDIFVIPSSPSINLTNWTFDFFFRSPLYHAPQKGLFNKSVVAPFQFFCVVQAAGKLALTHLIPAGLRGITSVINVDDNVWRHCAIVNDNTDLHLYLDGVLDITNPGAGGQTNITTNSFFIGRWRVPQNEYYEGEIDNFIYYNRPLDSTEILRHSARRYPPQ